MTTLLYTHQACLAHDPGPHHPESPARLEAVLEALSDPAFAGIERREAPAASIAQIARVHPGDFAERILDRQEHQTRWAAAEKAVDGFDKFWRIDRVVVVGQQPRRCLGRQRRGADEPLQQPTTGGPVLHVKGLNGFVDYGVDLFLHLVTSMEFIPGDRTLAR